MMFLQPNHSKTAGSPKHYGEFGPAAPIGATAPQDDETAGGASRKTAQSPADATLAFAGLLLGGLAALQHDHSHETRRTTAKRRAVGYAPGWVRGARWPTRLAWRLGLSWATCADLYVITG
jgi:hypothetical protein